MGDIEMHELIAELESRLERAERVVDAVRKLKSARVTYGSACLIGDLPTVDRLRIETSGLKAEKDVYDALEDHENGINRGNFVRRAVSL